MCGEEPKGHLAMFHRQIDRIWGQSTPVCDVSSVPNFISCLPTPFSYTSVINKKPALVKPRPLLWAEVLTRYKTETLMYMQL